MGKIISRAKVLPFVNEIHIITEKICYYVIQNEEYHSGYLKLNRKTIEEWEFDILWSCCQIVDKNGTLINISNMIKKLFSYTNKQLKNKNNRNDGIAKLKNYLHENSNQYYYSINRMMYSMSNIENQYIEFGKYSIFKPIKKRKSDFYKFDFGSVGSISN